MTDIEAYLDRACAGLAINPAQADDLRAELHSHLEEALLSQGIDLQDKAAVETALTGFGDPEKLAEFLGFVHQGEPLAHRYIQGFILGSLLGLSLAFLSTRDTGYAYYLRFFTTPIGENFPPLIWFNGSLVGGLLGLLSIKGRHLLLGWWVGLCGWLLEYIAYWVNTMLFIKSPGIPKPPTTVYHMLLIPVLGGSFGLFVTFGSRGLAYLLSRLRPEIR